MGEPPTDEARKQLRAQYKQSERADWEARLPLAVDDLEELLNHLDSHVGQDGCDHSFRHTEAWLAAHDHDVNCAVAGFREMGGGCDCEVLANVDPEGQV